MVKRKNYIYLFLLGASLFHIFNGNITFADKDTLNLFQEAENLFKAGNFRIALEKYEELISADPSFIRGYRGIIRCYNSLGDSQGALMSMESLLLEYPERGEVSYGMGYALYNMERYKDSLSYFKKAIKLNPDIAAAWNNCAVIYHFVIKDYRRARYYYKKAIDVSKKNGDDWVLGIANKNLFNLPEPIVLKPYTAKMSLEDFINKFIFCAEKNKDKELQGLILGQKENSKKAMEWFLGMAIRSYGNGNIQNENTLLGLAELLEDEYSISFENTDLTQLLGQYKNLSDNQKKNILAGENLLEDGAIKEKNGRYVEAQDYYKEALKCFESIGDKSRQGLALLYLGDVNRKIKNYSLAREMYVKGISFFVETGDEEREASALSSLGITCFMMGNNSDAIHYLNRSLEIYGFLNDKESISGVQNNIDLIKNEGQKYLD